MRIERRQSGSGVYLVAVENVYDPRTKRWRKRTVFSFGREGLHKTDVRMQGFLHALEGTSEYPTYRKPKKRKTHA